MAQLQIQSITNASVAVNGQMLFGSIKEASIAAIKFKMADYMALGMHGATQQVVGIEPMEGSLKLNHTNSNVVAKFGNPFNSVQMQLRTNKTTVQSGVATMTPLVWNVTCRPKNAPIGIDIKAQEAAEFEMELAIDAITVLDNNVEIYHFDATANTWRVNGVSITNTYNASLGL